MQDAGWRDGRSDKVGGGQVRFGWELDLFLSGESLALLSLQLFQLLCCWNSFHLRFEDCCVSILDIRASPPLVV